MSVTLGLAIEQALTDIAKKLDSKVTDGTVGIRHLQKGGARVNISFLITPKSDHKTQVPDPGVCAQNPRENQIEKTTGND